MHIIPLSINPNTYIKDKTGAYHMGIYKLNVVMSILNWTGKYQDN